jgi:FtsH-binding integral membrane protein
MATARTAVAAKPMSGVRVNRFLGGVYLIMAVGLAVTALVSFWVSTNEELLFRIATSPWFAWTLFLIQIFIVVALSAAVTRFSAGVAFLLFLAYSALTGLTLSTIFIYYSQSTIAYTFVVTAGMFLFSSVVGFLVKRDLSGLGMFLVLALAGWIFASFLTWFFPFATLMNQALNFAGILLFAALTVWDTQRLKILAGQLEGKKGMGGIMVVGALALYLDFINLFLLLLRRSGR